SQATPNLRTRLKAGEMKTPSRKLSGETATEKAAFKSKVRKGSGINRIIPSTPTPFPIVGIGASAGGLEAFTNLLRHLPMDTGSGSVLVQHLDPPHKSVLTELLARMISMPLQEAT